MELKKLMAIILFMISPIMLCGQATHTKRITIEEMFNLAETNSRCITIADIAEKEAEQSVRVARNAELPTINVSLSGSYLGNGQITNRDFTNITKAAMPHWGNNFLLEATQVIYAGGAITSSIDLARLQRQSAKLEKERSRQDIRFLLVGNYLEMYKLYNQRKVYLKNIEQTEKLVSNIKAKQVEGLALKNDITRYELQLKTLELSLTQVDNSIIIINNKLTTLLQLPEETIIEIDNKLLDELPSAPHNLDWQSVAEMNLPELQQARIAIEQSKKNVSLVNAERLPSVALFAANHFDGPITIEVPPINKNLNYWYVGVSIKYNISSIYKTGKRVNLAKLSTKKASENKLLLEETVQTEVKEAQIRYIEAFTLYETQMKSLELATQNYSAINNRYLNDLALITEMLDASNSKLSAELQVANSQINILFNYYRLKRVAGDL